MRLWLLLASLLISDLRPLRDEDPVVDDYSWGLCRTLFYGELMALRGLEMLLTHVSPSWLCIQSNCAYGVVQHKQWDVVFHQEHVALKDPSNPALAGTIHCSHSPVMAVFLLRHDGEGFPGFLASDSLPVICFISGDTLAAGGITYTAVTIPDSQCVWLAHHHSAASSSRVQTFLLETSRSWATATIAPWKKTLTKRHCTAALVIISCCFKEGEKRSARDMKKISRRQTEEAPTRQRENAQQARGGKYLKQDDGRHSSPAVVSQQDFVQASAPHAGSIFIKTSDSSKLETRRNAAGISKKSEYLNMNDEPTLQKSPREQLSIKPATRVDDDDGDDGFYVNKQHLLESREKTQHNLRPAQGSRSNFNEEKITQAELQAPERESETVENGNQKISANILQSDFTGAREWSLIVLFLPDTQRQTQTEPESAETITLKPVAGRETIKIPLWEPREPPPVTLHVINTDHFKRKCLKERLFLSVGIYAIDVTAGRYIKPAEIFTKAPPVSAYTEEEKREHTETNNASHESMSINHIKQEEHKPPRASVTPPPPLGTETMETDHKAEETTINTDIKETTSAVEVFNHSREHKDDELPGAEETPTSTLDSEPRCLKCPATSKIESGTGTSFTGLRMREDVLADLRTPHKSGAKDDDAVPTGRPEKGPEASLCAGLIHRTEAGCRHCMERLAASKAFSSGEALLAAFQEAGHASSAEAKDRPRNANEYDRFYYVDGVLRTVQSPRHRRRRSQENTGRRVPTAGRGRTTRQNE